MASFKLKNLCDESSKIKNLRWQISWTFRCRRRGMLRFFCRCCFYGEIYRTKLPVLEIFKKKTQKRVFSYSKIWSLETFFNVFFPTHLVGLSKRIVFHPQTFIKDTKWVNISSTWLVYKLSQLSTSLSYTVCPFSPVKKYLLIARARKQPITWEFCHFVPLFGSFWYLVPKKIHIFS